MDSYKVELLRFGTDTGGFQDRYLVAAGDLPARAVDPAVTHADVLVALDALRYRPGQDAVVVQSKLDFLTGLIAKFLPDPPDGSEPVHIDIVTDKVELWALPFEFAKDKSHRYLLGDPNRTVLLTRRVRQAFAENKTAWPKSPRLLFAWSGDVDASGHRAALYEAMEPWLGPTGDGLIPDLTPVMTEVRRASLSDIAAASKQALAAGRPYTHVHVLAHGAELPASIAELASFGVALESGTATAGDLAGAIGAGTSRGPVVVTLATCDSANASKTLVAGGRVAYEIHARGVPVVIGSQLPLTQVGAVVFARSFYKGILADARDVRQVLCDARAELKKNQQSGHDWASITMHLRLAEGYGAELHDASLAVEFAKMNTASRWAQLIVEGGVQADEAQRKRIERLLQDRVMALAGNVTRNEKRGLEATLENHGLLGSCYKRLAELVFCDPADGAATRSRELLELSDKFYYKAHESQLSHHWTGTQHLAIAAVILGRIPEERSINFSASLHAAGLEANLNPAVNDATRSRVLWAFGSLTELRLLRPLLPSVKSEPDAKAALQQLIALALQAPARQDVLESTLAQLRRYVRWWTRANGFFGSREEDLAAPARELVALIEPHVPAAHSRAPVSG